MRILAAADLYMRVRLAPYDDHDDVLDVLDALHAACTPEERDARDAAHAAPVDRFARRTVAPRA